MMAAHSAYVDKILKMLIFIFLLNFKLLFLTPFKKTSEIYVDCDNYAQIIFSCSFSIKLSVNFCQKKQILTAKFKSHENCQNLP